MNIKSVSIDGFHKTKSANYTFDKLNYIHGPNGVGKSTILQAIQLALLGYIPGTSKSSKEAIFRHAGGKILSVSVVLDDNGSDVEVTRTWAGSKSNIISTVEIDPEGYSIESVIKDLELPVFNFNDFVGLTANKLKDWFINFLPKESLSIDWEDELKSAAQSKGVSEFLDETVLSDMLDYIKQSKITDIEGVRQLNQYIKQLLSFKKGEYDRMNSTIQSLIYYDDFVPEYSIEELDAMIRHAQDQLMKAVQYNEATARNAEVLSKLSEYSDLSDGVENDKQYRATSISIEEITATISDLSSKLSEIEVRKADLAYSMKDAKRLTSSTGLCPYTQEACESISAKIKEASKEVSKLESEMSGIDELHDDLRNKLDEARKASSDFTRQLSSIEQKYRTRDMLKASFVDVPDISPEDADRTKWSAEIDELNDTKAKTLANHKYNEAVDKFTKDKYVIEQTILVYKAWDSLTGVNGLQSKADAAVPFIKFAASIDPYVQILFGESVHAKFNIEGKANSFSFGIDNGKYIPFDLLSSGEKCVYTIALLLGLVKASSSGLKILLVDDLFDHLDDSNFKDLMESLSSIEDIQLIFAGVKDPVGNMNTIELR